MCAILILFLVSIHSQGLADNTVIAKVDKELWDLDRPLERDCSLQLLKFDDEEAQAVSPEWFSISLFMGVFHCTLQLSDLE